jgi:hypothetical protein
MRKLTIEEMNQVAGGEALIGDITILSGNGILSGNHVEVSNVLNGNSLLNGALNGSLNGTGILNFSGNEGSTT